LFLLLKLDIFKLKHFAIIQKKVFSINLLIAKLMHDTAYIAITYWKRVHYYWDTSEGSILNVHRSDGCGVLIQKYCQTKSYCNTSLVSERSFSIALKTHATHNVYTTLRELVIYPSSEHISKLRTRDVSESAALETSRVCSVMYVL